MAQYNVTFKVEAQCTVSVDTENPYDAIEAAYRRVNTHDIAGYTVEPILVEDADGDIVL